MASVNQICEKVEALEIASKQHHNMDHGEAEMPLSKDFNNRGPLKYLQQCHNKVMLVLLHKWIDKGGRKMFDHEELFNGLWLGAFKALCFSCGYFAYDQWDMLNNHLYKPQAPSLLVHHALLLVCFSLALYRFVTINYLILTLVCELHSIFLHLRRVLRMAGLRRERSLRTRIEWGLHWFTFFTARLFTHWFITYKLIKDASKFPRGIELPLAVLGMAGMNVLNIFLGFDIFKACKKELIGAS